MGNMLKKLKKDKKSFADILWEREIKRAKERDEEHKLLLEKTRAKSIGEILFG